MLLAGDRPKGTIEKDCVATLIPSGERTLLAAGTIVTVTQALGSSLTIHTHDGQLARINAVDAQHAGLAHHLTNIAPATYEGELCDDHVVAALKEVFDPEIPVNVVDLGLIYGHTITPLAEGEHHVTVRMSMTAPGCGMGDVLQYDAKEKLLEIPGVTEATIEMVWDPPWSMALMSDEAKLQLGIM